VAAIAGGVQAAEREREGQGFDWLWARREDERGDKKQDEAGTATRAQRVKTRGSKVAVLGTGRNLPSCGARRRWGSVACAAATPLMVERRAEQQRRGASPHALATR
jgi:hypothetical protein